MSRIRKGTCGEPGPRDLHCQDYPGHRYTCHDGDECWAEWHFEAFDLPPHKCSDPTCSPVLVDAGEVDLLYIVLVVTVVVILLLLLGVI